jgi:hypothetical protein
MQLFLFHLCGGTLGIAATTGLLYQPRMTGDGDCGEIGGTKIGRGNRRTREKTCPIVTLSTTNPTWLYPGTYATYKPLFITLSTLQYDSNVADLVDAPDDGPLRPKHVKLLYIFIYSV